MSERMGKLLRSLSFRRKKKKRRQESSKPQQWQEDEKKVRDGSCSFQVKYLGCMEVFESRGMQVCEEAIKNLIKVKSKHHKRAVLYVNGEALRVVDEISKGLIVDQTIEKVSFCAPDRNHEKGFAYICRDGATRRWMCHGFLAVKESGERLSHAVGCAFAICLEKKQEREKDSVQVQFNDKGTAFERMGSFRQATLTEKMLDPQCAIMSEPVPVTQRPEATDLTAAVPRPQANPQMFERQSSLRLFPKLNQGDNSPFRSKAYASMRLPGEMLPNARAGGANGLDSAIPEELSAVAEQQQQQQAARSPLQPQQRVLSSLLEEQQPQQPQVPAAARLNGGDFFGGGPTAAPPPPPPPQPPPHPPAATTPGGGGFGAVGAAKSYNPFLSTPPEAPAAHNPALAWPSLTPAPAPAPAPAPVPAPAAGASNTAWRQFDPADPFDVAWADQATRALQPSRTNPFLPQEPHQVAALGRPGFRLDM